MSKLGWGKCDLYIKNLNVVGAKYRKLPTPVENSTVLNTTQGQKTEANVEGGDAEDVRYSANAYALNTNIRIAKDRKKPIGDNDGVIKDEYEVILVPEDPTVPSAIKIDRSKPGLVDSFNSADGGVWQYSFDALKPTDGSDKVKWGTATVSGSEGSYTIQFTPIEEETDE